MTQPLSEQMRVSAHRIFSILTYDVFARRLTRLAPFSAIPFEAVRLPIKRLVMNKCHLHCGFELIAFGVLLTASGRRQLFAHQTIYKVSA